MSIKTARCGDTESVMRGSGYTLYNPADVYNVPRVLLCVHTTWQHLTAAVWRAISSRWVRVMFKKGKRYDKQQSISQKTSLSKKQIMWPKVNHRGLWSWMECSMGKRVIARGLEGACHSRHPPIPVVLSAPQTSVSWAPNKSQLSLKSWQNTLFHTL